MVAKTSILKELETIYEKSGNQLYVLYGRTDSEKEQLLKAFLSNKKYFLLSQQTGIGTGTEKSDGGRNPTEVFDEYYKAQL